MKIAILNMTGGGMSGGYKKYLQNMLPLLAADPGVEAILSVAPKTVPVQDWVKPMFKVAFTECRPFRFFNNFSDSRLEKQLKDFSPDVIFIPLERFFKFGDTPVVNMVQNLEPFIDVDFDVPLIGRLKRFARRRVGAGALKKSDRIIVVSEYCRQVLIASLGIPAGKIGLVYHGIEPPSENVRFPRSLPENFQESFLFTAGSIWPGRGLEDIIGALIYFKKKSLPVPCTVIAGGSVPGMENYKANMEKLIRENDLSSRVAWAGELDDEEMNWCFKNCLAFVMTSRVESFGLVAGEALARGCLCVSSDSPSLPEILGNGAIFYPAGKSEMLAQKIAEAINFPDEKKQELRYRAFARSMRFGWEECAKKTVDEFQKAIDSSSRSSGELI